MQTISLSLTRNGPLMEQLVKHNGKLPRWILYRMITLIICTAVSLLRFSAESEQRERDRESWTITPRSNRWRGFADNTVVKFAKTTVSRNSKYDGKPARHSRNKFALPVQKRVRERQGREENRITILDSWATASCTRSATRNRNGRVCRHQELLSPLLNYYLASLYQVRRGGNATVVRPAEEEGEGGRRVWRAWHDDDENDIDDEEDTGEVRRETRAAHATALHFIARHGFGRFT